MEFTEFAKILKPIIGGSYNTHMFARTLFESIVTDDGILQIEDISESTFKSYYNGKTKVTKISQRVLPHIDPEQFISYLDGFSEATTQRLCDAFEVHIDGITLHNASDKIAYFFEGILTTAAGQERKRAEKSIKKTEGPTPSERINEKILASGQALADTWGKVVEALADDMDKTETPKPMKPILVVENLNESDKQFLKRFRTEAKPILRYCIDTDPSAEATKLSLADEINELIYNWQYDYREIEDIALRTIVTDTMTILGDYTYYLTEQFLRLIPDRNILWFRNESWEEGEQLRNILQPETYEKRCQMGEIYLRLYPLPEDVQTPNSSSCEETHSNTCNHQTNNVIQSGNNNVNITNNGNLTIKM